MANDADVTLNRSARRFRLDPTLWLASAVLLWPFLAFILSSDRGIDLTDEGLYLLEADPPSPTAAWGFPYGWHIGPLFRIVGYDVANFRTLGAVLLVLGSAALGIESLRVGRRLRAAVQVPSHGGSLNSIQRLETATAAITGGLGGLLYYAGLFRTPSYNWLVIFGLVVAVLGLLMLLQGSEPRSRTRISAVAVTGFGLFLSVPAKPTTPVFFALLSLLLLSRIIGLRAALRYLAGVTAVSVALLGAAVLSGLWPTNFVAVFLRALQLPRIVESHTLAGAFINVLRMPEKFLRASPSIVLLIAALAIQRSHFRLSSTTARLLLRLVAASAVVAVVVVPPLVRRVYRGEAGVLNPLVRGRDFLPIAHYYTRAAVWAALLLIAGALFVVLTDPRWRESQKSWMTAALCLPIPLHLAKVVESSLFSTSPPRRLFDPGLPAAAFGLVLIAALTRSGHRHDRPRESEPSLPSWPPGSLPLLAAFITSMSVVAAFGTANGLNQQIQLSIVFFTSSALLIVGSAGDRSQRAPGLSAVAAGMLVLALIGILDSRGRPYWYASESFATQTVQTPVGHRGAQLKLDPIRSAWLTDLRVTAESAGWRQGTPLYGTTVSWGASTIPWHLGARVPESIMPTLHTESRLRFNLDREDLKDWDQAWILVEVPAPTAFQGSAEASVRYADLFSSAVGLRFPDDYVVVWTAPADTGWFANVQLWRPVAPDPGN
jgi:hypothetical protein